MNDKKEREAIVAGERVGAVSLSDSMDDVVRKLGNRPFTWEDRASARVLRAEPYAVWFDKDTNAISQILVKKGFPGLFLSRIGIGSTLRDVTAVAGSYRDVDDAYHLDEHPGICFELEDVDDWDEETAPIESITVFPVET